MRGVTEKQRQLFAQDVAWKRRGADKIMFAAPRKGIPLDSRAKRGHLCTDCRCLFLQTTTVCTNLDFKSHRKHLSQKVTKNNAQISKPISNL